MCVESSYIKISDPLLHRPIKEVAIRGVPFSQDVLETIKKLIKIGQEESLHFCGLAAPQIGIDQQVIVVDFEVENKEQNRQKKT